MSKKGHYDRYGCGNRGGNATGIEGRSIAGSYLELKRLKFILRNHRGRPQISYSIIEQNKNFVQFKRGETHLWLICQ